MLYAEIGCIESHKLGSCNNTVIYPSFEPGEQNKGCAVNENNFDDKKDNAAWVLQLVHNFFTRESQLILAQNYELPLYDCEDVSQWIGSGRVKAIPYSV